MRTHGRTDGNRRVFGGESPGTRRVLIQNGDWGGILPPPSANSAERTFTPSGSSLPLRNAEPGRYASVDTGGEMVTRVLNLSCRDLRGGVHEVITMYMVGRIKRMHFRDGKSVREIARQMGLSRNTVRTWLRAPAEQEPRYQRTTRPGKLMPFHMSLVQALKADAMRPKKEQRTSLTLYVAKAAANRGANVDTEPSISPASPGCTNCSMNRRCCVVRSLCSTAALRNSSQWFIHRHRHIRPTGR